MLNLTKNILQKINFSKVTDLEEKTDKVLEKLSKIILNMTQLEDMFSIETPRFRLVHKNSNISSFPFNMEIENNSFKLSGLFNLTENHKKINETNQITLKVNDLHFKSFFKILSKSFLKIIFSKFFLRNSHFYLFF